jgi:hypothetical protein
MTTKTDAKTETPKTDTAQAAAGKPEAPRFPMPWELPWMTGGHEAFARGQEMFSQLMNEQIARTQKVMDEFANYEAVAAQRARAAVADLAKLATDSLDYCAKVTAEWRKVAVDNGRKAVEQVAPRA